jgi:hypothetical protein
MEQKTLLPCSQDPDPGQYNEPDETSPYPISLKSYLILRHAYLLLGNDLINTFPSEPTRGRIGRPLLGNESVNTPPRNRGSFSVGFVQSSYKEVFGSKEQSSREQSRVSGRQPARICAWN